MEPRIGSRNVSWSKILHGIVSKVLKRGINGDSQSQEPSSQVKSPMGQKNSPPGQKKPRMRQERLPPRRFKRMPDGSVIANNEQEKIYNKKPGAVGCEQFI